MQMKERHSSDSDFPKWLKLLGGWRINRDSIDFKWGYFAPRFGFEFKFHRGGYFDQHMAISFCPIWGHWHFTLPFKTKLSEGCDLPEYGIAIHNDTLWVYRGGEYDESLGQCLTNNWWTWDLPWVSLELEFHQLKSQDGWIDYSFDNIDKAHTETFDFIYQLPNGETQQRTATVYEEVRQYYRKWFPWVKKTFRTIKVSFDKEVGNETGSWKGGVVGCSYNMLPGEMMEQTFRRMETERTF